MKSETKRIASGRSWQVFTGGSGPSLLWLHGLRGVDVEDPLLVELQRSYTVTAPVAPGFNDLAELDRIDNIHELALDYDDLIEALGLKDFVLVGHSFGGMIAAEIAAHFPKRAKRLVLMAPFGLWNDAYPVADVFAVPFTQMDDILWQDADARARYAKPLEGDLMVKEVADQMIRLAQSLTAVTKFVWPIPDRGLGRRLGRIACPTLVVLGAGDTVVSPRYADDIRRGIRNAETVVLQGAGHMIPYEQPKRMLELIGRGT